MTKPKEEPNAGEYPQKKNDHAFDVSQYKDRFEEAVLDAQFMMDYAATNTKSVIAFGNSGGGK